MESDSINTFVESRNEALVVSLEHLLNQLDSFSKDFYQFLIAEEEQSCESASLFLKEADETMSDSVALHVVFHQHG